ncbi:MAG: hypothetical protein ACOCV1_00820 [Bacillota bacterium]
MLWFNSKNKYSEKEVEYIVKAILRQTVDRDNLKSILGSELRPIVGDEVLYQVLERLNFKDNKTDITRFQDWMQKIKTLKDSGSLR